MPPIRRRNILVGARMVHYRRAGSGKPVVLLHESPMNSSAFVDLIERLRRSFTVFAFDTPGFGDSDPIPRSELRAHHFADALAETFRALKMPRCPVYGLDTGAAIALSFGRRHPQLTSGLVLQGLPIFDAADRREFLENYTPPFANRWDGSHLTGLWTRIRDHRTFFPWYSRNAAGRGVRPIPPAEELHERLMGFLRAGNHYRHGYDAAFGQDAERLLRKVRVPLTLLGQRGGLLAPPLEDLRLSDNQRVVWISPGGESPVRALRAAFRDYSGRGRARRDQGSFNPHGRTGVGFVDLSFGQLRVRHFRGQGGRPLLILHDCPGSSALLEPIAYQLGQDRPIYAIDLPGHGDSDPLPQARPDATAFAEALEGTLNVLGIRDIDLVAIGLSAPIATEMSLRPLTLVRRLVIENAWLFSAAEKKELRANYFQSITPHWDGSHLYRTWLMLRDQELFWPWYRRTAAAAIIPSGTRALSAKTLHDRTVEVLKSPKTYHLAADAAFRYPMKGRLRRVNVPTLLLCEDTHPAIRDLDAAAQLVPGGRAVRIRPGIPARRRLIQAFLDS